MDKMYKTARCLRKKSTQQEQKLWNVLRNRQIMGLKFKRQVPVGGYIVDFLCKEKMIIIELDGGQHNQDRNILLDNIRTKFLLENGFKVLRFWNTDIDKNIEGVVEKIQDFCK